MKNIFYNYYIRITLFITISTASMFNAQIVVDITSNNSLPPDYNETGQFYEKDIHNYLDSFVGTWEYVNGNEKFQIILTKIVKSHYVNTKLNLNFYEDGIAVYYKKHVNNSLVFTSPISNQPSFKTFDGQKLEGSFVDYGRVTVQVHWPSFSNLGVLHQGGEYFRPQCIIEKMSNIPNEPQRIKLKLYLQDMTGGMGNPYKNPLYTGQPTLSVPNMVVMKKVP